MVKITNGMAVIILAGLLGSCGKGEDKAALAPVAETEAATTASLETPLPSFLPGSLRAFGTEPFWSAEISDGQLTYSTPENLDAGGEAANVTRHDGAESVKFTATINAGLIEILVTPGECGDGMSDNTYPWKVERTLNDETVEGCAEPVRT